MVLVKYAETASDVFESHDIELKMGVPVTVGRDPSSDIVCQNIRVSAHHCTILLDSNGLCVNSIGRNGTFYWYPEGSHGEGTKRIDGKFDNLWDCEDDPVFTLSYVEPDQHESFQHKDATTYPQLRFSDDESGKGLHLSRILTKKRKFYSISDAAISSRDTEISTLNAMYSRLAHEKKQLEEANASLRKRIEASDSSLAKQIEEAKGFHRLLKEGARKRIAEEESALEKEIQEATSSQQLLKETNASLQSDNHSLTTQLSDLARSIKSIEEKYEAIIASLCEEKKETRKFLMCALQYGTVNSEKEPCNDTDEEESPQREDYGTERMSCDDGMCHDGDETQAPDPDATQLDS
jgi:hypothetical protein